VDVHLTAERLDAVSKAGHRGNDGLVRRSKWRYREGVRGSRIVFAIVIVSIGACSSQSGLVGNGACDGFCAKVVGANCRVQASSDECIAKCVFYQTDPTASKDATDPNACSTANSKMLRCATIDGNVGCVGGSGRAHIVGCDPIVAARAGACGVWFSEAGIDQSGP
jgi:hypothetical protein